MISFLQVILTITFTWFGTIALILKLVLTGAVALIHFRTWVLTGGLDSFQNLGLNRWPCFISELVQDVQARREHHETDGHPKHPGKSKNKCCFCCSPSRIRTHSEVYPENNGPTAVTITYEERGETETETETDGLSLEHAASGSGRHMRKQRGERKIPKYVDQLSKKGADVDQVNIFT